MAKLICKQCNYKFDSVSDALPKKCPYCGKERTVKKESSAEDIVGEVNRIMQEAENQTK